MNRPFLYSKSRGRVIAAVIDETDRALVFDTLRKFYPDLQALSSAELVESKAKAASLGTFASELYRKD